MAWRARCCYKRTLAAMQHILLVLCKLQPAYSSDIIVMASGYRKTLFQELQDLQRESSNCKISIHPPEIHLHYEKQKHKSPTAALRIPIKLILLWRALREKQGCLGVPASSFIELLKNSIEPNDGITLYSPHTQLEARLRKECSRTKMSYKRKHFDPKEQLIESEIEGHKLMLIYSAEGKPSQSSAHSEDSTENLVPKLHINGNQPVHV